METTAGLQTVLYIASPRFRERDYEEGIKYGNISVIWTGSIAEAIWIVENHQINVIVIDDPRGEMSDQIEDNLSSFLSIPIIHWRRYKLSNHPTDPMIFCIFGELTPHELSETIQIVFNSSIKQNDPST